jgi:hypothetical protein
MISLSNSLLNPSLYGNALTSYNPTTANLSSLYGLGSTSLSNLGLTGSSLDLPNLSALSGLYGTSDHRTLLVALANQNAQLKEKLEEVTENRTGFLGLPILGANKENGNGGFDLGSGGLGGLIGYFLPKLLKGEKLFG